MDSVEIGKISIPAIRGEKGDKGNAGEIKELKIKMLDPTDNPTIENTGTEQEAIIEIGIPKGDDIVEANIDENGDLIFKTESQKIFNVGTVKGTGISNVIIIDNNLVVTLTNGSEINLGNVKGDKGDTGEKGENGFSPTITEKVNSDDEYILEVTDKNGTYETPNLKINADKAIEEKGIFYWDGQSSINNPENINLWQRIIDKSKEQTVIVFSSKENSNSNVYNAIFIINKNTISSNITSFSIKGLVNNFNVYNSNNGSYITATNASVILKFSNNILYEVNTLSYNTPSSATYLPLDKQTITNYTPTYDYHPATKKYVDDSIINSLSEISGLTPEIVDTLPEEGNANKIYLVPDEKATENDLYNEYLFINNKYEKIGKTNIAGADLSEYVKKDEVPLIYNFNWTTTTSSSERNKFFQNIVDKHSEGKDVLLVMLINNRTFIYLFESTKLLDNNKYFINSNYYIDTTLNNNYSENIFVRYYSLTIIVQDNLVTSVTNNYANIKNAIVLECNTSNDTDYFSPTHKSQPVSKGYLDERLGNLDIIQQIYDTLYPIGRGFVDFTDTDYSYYLGFTWEKVTDQVASYWKRVPFGSTSIRYYSIIDSERTSTTLKFNPDNLREIKAVNIYDSEDNLYMTITDFTKEYTLTGITRQTTFRLEFNTGFIDHVTIGA